MIGGHMNNDKRMLVLVGIGLLILAYMAWVNVKYNPSSSSNSVGVLPKHPTQSEYTLPELSDEEQTVSDSLHKSYVKQAETESESKSIEAMREQVIEILDEITEEDSTVTISFNMQWTPSWVQ